MNRPIRAPRDKGAVAISVALVLLLLMGLTALAMDGGLAYNERRATQNSADNAALAAAWAACHGEDPIAAATEVAVANGYQSAADPSVDVTITDLSAGEFEVVISSTKATSFGAAVGTDEVTVVSDAVASCEEIPGGSDYSIFAGGDCGIWNSVLLTGPNVHVNGAVHSNGGINIGTTSNKWVSEPSTYVDHDPSQIPAFDAVFVPGGHSSTSTQPYPVPAEWTVSNYAPGGARAIAAGPANYVNHPTSSVPDTSLTPGLHYFPNDADIYQSGPGGLVLDNVTIVANGTITLPGSIVEMTPFEPDGLLLFAHSSGTPGCSRGGVQVATSNARLEGTIYAPNGTAGLDSATTTYDGSVIAYQVRLASSGVTFNENPYAGIPQYSIQLEE